MKNKIYSIVRFVQSADDDYNRIEAVFSGISLYYWKVILNQSLTISVIGEPEDYERDNLSNIP